MPLLRIRSGSRKTQTQPQPPPPPQAPKAKAPAHPFPELQGPFEESMTELERQEEVEVPSDAASRRTILLDAPTYERVIAGRWKQRPGEKYHPLWKIVAQLSFGIHLLADGLAKSEEEVMQILQGHIDEIDLFLERTAEDFALAQDDIQERMRCLQLPLQHPAVFDRMLEDKKFRNSIVEGNEKIEHIVGRTQCAMRDSLKDAQKGLDATSALEQYLASLEESWGRRNADHEAVFEAMLENVEGWRTAFIDLHAQGDKLGRLLKQLTEVVNQMQQRAGEISRKLARSQQKHGQSPANSNITFIPSRQSTSSAGTRSGTPVKPLPGVPNRGSTRQPSRQSQRPETAQSTRSMASQRSNDIHKSRAPSREGAYSLRDSTQSRTNTKSPRIIDIKRPSQLSTKAAQAAPSLQNDMLKPVGASQIPVELPAEMSRASGANRSVRHVDSMNAGLGILQSEPVEMEGSPQSPALTIIGPVKGAAGSSTLPLTPRSMNSSGDASLALAHELPSESVSHRVSAPSLSSGRAAGGSSVGSPPSTPGWAKQTFDSAERDRMAGGKNVYRPHPPIAELSGPPVMEPSRFNSQSQHARVNGSVASSLGAPGPEVTSTGQSSPVKSRSVDGHSTKGSTSGVGQPTELTTDVAASSINDGKKSFIAELPGVTPLTRRPIVYANGMVRQAPREIVSEAVELEVPSHLPQTLVTIPERTTADPSVASPDGGRSEEPNLRSDLSPISPSTTLQRETTSVEDQVVAAIRKSFIATNIELPDTSIGRASAVLTARAPEPEEKAPQTIVEASNTGMDDIREQLEKLSASTPNLSLKAEEILITLPATTYVAKHEHILQKPLSTPALSSPNVTSPESSSSEIWSDSGLTKLKSGRSLRNSLASTASSQSQWRAFFKGQLSPADFNSTPQLTSKGSSQHKAIIELQRRGQESSPTLGWQWAPETPDVTGGDHSKTPQI